MAEPLSFVASVVAVAALAEKVVTGGYRYLKAVKNCPDEVRNLMAETNVLCGILGRLTVLLGGNRSKSETATKLKKRATWHGEDNDESSDEEGAFSSENEIISASDNSMRNSSIVFGDVSYHLHVTKPFILPTSFMNARKLCTRSKMSLKSFNTPPSISRDSRSRSFDA